MGISAAMYSGVSGLLCHGEKLSVVGNNLANVSTVGFKASNMHFEDALSQWTHTTGGLDQIGRGVMVERVMGDFSQGSLERTNDTQDVGISGKGFFVVSKPGEDGNMFSRAGNFRFNAEGYYVDPHGYRVQGWEVDQEAKSAPGEAVIKGDIKDVRLDSMQSPPKATDYVRMKANLNSEEIEKANKLSSADPIHAGKQDDPLRSLFNSWKYNPADPDERPLGDQMYAMQDTMRVYDENGGSHELTMYFDPIDDVRFKEASDGNRYWEFMVAVPPNEDNRQFWNTHDDGTVPDQSKRGVLMTGILKFSPGGKLLDMSAYTINQPHADQADADSEFVTNFDDPARWLPANFSENGYPVCTANFLGTKYGDVTKYEPKDPTVGGGTDVATVPNLPSDDVVASNANIEIDFGMFSKDKLFKKADKTLADLGVTVTDTPQDVKNLLKDNLVEFQEPKWNDSSLTSYNQKSSVIDHHQNGYGVGSLRNVSFSQDGVLTGHYTNGQQIDHYVLGMAVFRNEYGLVREGGNIFTETRASGQAMIGRADTAGRGRVVGNHLENSNVDMAAEFVKMITTEKGFQANSKVVTTSDAMLTTVIQMKR